MRLWLFSALMAVATPASSQDYMISFKNDASFLVFASAYDVTVEKGRSRIWVHYYFYPGENGVDSVKLLKEFSCQTKKVQTLQSTEYGPEGKNVRTITEEGEVSYVVPRSHEEQELRFACNPPAFRTSKNGFFQIANDKSVEDIVRFMREKFVEQEPVASPSAEAPAAAH